MAVLVAMVAPCPAQDIVNFRMVHPHHDVLQQHAATGHVVAVVGYDVVTQRTDAVTNYYWVNKRWELTDKFISGIGVETTRTSSVSLVLNFSPTGSRKLAMATSADRQRILAAFAGERFLTLLPITDQVTGGQIRLDGVLSREEAEDLRRRFDQQKAEQGGGHVR